MVVVETHHFRKPPHLVVILATWMAKMDGSAGIKGDRISG